MSQVEYGTMSWGVKAEMVVCGGWTYVGVSPYNLVQGLQDDVRDGAYVAGKGAYVAWFMVE